MLSEIGFLVLPVVATRGRAPLRFSPRRGQGYGVNPFVGKSFEFGTLARNSSSDVRAFLLIDLLKISGLGISSYFNSEFRRFKTQITLKNNFILSKFYTFK